MAGPEKTMKLTTPIFLERGNPELQDWVEVFSLEERLERAEHESLGLAELVPPNAARFIDPINIAANLSIGARPTIVTGWLHENAHQFLCQ